mgnify:CR=1 FL=1
MAARRGVVREEHKATDYDEEARKLFRQLNLPPDGDASRGRSMYNNLDAIYRHPKSGGVVYVGNISAARSADILRKNNISRVVNCQVGLAGSSDAHCPAASEWCELRWVGNRLEGMHHPAFVCLLSCVGKKMYNRGNQLMGRLFVCALSLPGQII